MEQRTQKNRSHKSGEQEALRREFLRHLQLSLGTTLARSTRREQLAAICLVVRGRLAQRELKTEQAYAEARVKRAYYLSAEFLLGRALENNLIHLGIRSDVERLLDELNPGRSMSLGDLLEEEPDAGLGNGGLGRLAACFMESACARSCSSMSPVPQKMKRACSLAWATRAAALRKWSGPFWNVSLPRNTTCAERLWPSISGSNTLYWSSGAL